MIGKGESMQIQIEQLRIDLGETHIENIFLSHYLCEATGKAIKVYLFLLKQAQDQYAKDITMKRLTTDLQLSEEEVEEALRYWKQEGILELDRVDAPETAIIRSMRQKYLDSCCNHEIAPHRSTVFEEHRADTWLQYKDRIENVLGVELTPNNIQQLMDIEADYHFDKEVIVYAFEYMASKGDRKNINYVTGVLRNWYMDNLKTIEDIKNSLEKPKKRIRNPKKRNYYRKSDDNNETLKSDSDIEERDDLFFGVDDGEE